MIYCNFIIESKLGSRLRRLLAVFLLLPSPSSSSYLSPSCSLLLLPPHPPHAISSLLSSCVKHPEVNWVALEQRFDRVHQIWTKMALERLENLVVIGGEANNVLNKYLQADRRAFSPPLSIWIFVLVYIGFT